MAHLEGGKVDISLIKATERRSFFDLLEKCPGSKALIFESSLGGPIGLVAEYLILKERYSAVKIFPLRVTALPETPGIEHMIFITRPKLENMDLISQNIRSEEKRGTKKQFHLFFVPDVSQLCVEKLKHLKVYGSFGFVEAFECHLFPFDSDVVSMEISDVFREYTLENDPTYLYQTAKAIIFLQKLYGPIPRVWGKGPAAKQVWDLVARLQREKNNMEPIKTNQTSSIDKIFLIDRSVDLITPLATQLTYEGLMDEFFGFKNNAFKLPADSLKSQEEMATQSMAEEKKIIILNSSDSLFANIRDKNFNAVGAHLSKQAKSISAQIENAAEKSVQEMKIYVQKLPQLLANKNALAYHTAIAECIKARTDSFEFLDTLQAEQEFLNCIDADKSSGYIEELICEGKPLIQVLRLICLQCLTNSGLKAKILEGYKKELVQVYGLEALLAITKLEKVGLLKAQTGTRQYTVLRKTLQLTMEDTSEINPTDISYVHSVYAPLSVRLVEQVTKNGGWKQIQDVLGLLPGPTLDESPPTNSLINSESSESTSVVLVFFIGGCTFAEISALRFLSQQEDSNIEFVIATTCLINGNTFLESITK